LNTLPPKKDLRSVSELFSAATDWRQEEGWGDWSAVTTLHCCGTHEVLERALALAVSNDPRCRARAADILGQLGIPDRTFPDECFDAVVGLLEHDPDPCVLKSAAVALGHLKDPRGTNSLVRRAQHEVTDIRYAVAYSLGGWDDPRAIAALIRLTSDKAAMVRDWATFGLGEIGKVDTPEVREALCRRLDDTDEETRFEALRGLARCGDLRVVEPLIAAIEAAPDDLTLVPGGDPAQGRGRRKTHRAVSRGETSIVKGNLWAGRESMNELPPIGGATLCTPPQKTDGSGPPLGLNRRPALMRSMEE
jgi:HEAT repeat protein/PBS lyase HEAT-like repeat-containing protein